MYAKCRALIYLALILAFPACKTLETIVFSEESSDGEVLIDKIEQFNQGYDTFSSARVNISVELDGNSYSFRGVIRIKKDSAIMVSLNPLAGIEMYRLLFLVDSVKFIDRINNSYFTGTYYEAGRILPVAVSYTFLQKLLTGAVSDMVSSRPELINPGLNYIAETDGKYKFISENPVVINLFTGSMADYTVFYFSHDFSRHSFSTYYGNGDIIEAEYSDFELFGNTQLPTRSDITIKLGGQTIRSSLNFNRIELNNSITFPFSVPTRYEPL